jgi:hypothetical protein
MREGHHLIRRIVETLDIGDDEDLFGPERVAREATTAGDGGQMPPEVSFDEALRSLLGSTTAGSHG